jgi:hypothetical protein
VHEAIRCGKITVENDPVAGELSCRVAFHLPMGAAEVMVRLDEFKNRK